MVKTNAKGLSPIVEIERSSGTAIHLQVADSLRRGIQDGRIVGGTRLASSRILASDWGVSRNTVIQVFATLVAEGILVSRVGDGTYVAMDARLDPEACADTDGIGGSPGRYPFRDLSRRGRILLSEPDYGVPERPRPFMPNVPDLRSFPIRSWLRLLNEVSGALTGDALAGVSSAGFMPLRKAIAHHVSITRALPCSADQVIVTTGSQQGLDLTSRLLADRGDPIWMENPGYLGTQAALAANGANIQRVPVDGEGMDIAAGIETALAPRIICVSAARQFPTGAVLSPSRRHALLEFTSRTGAWIIEDDYDSELHYAAPPPIALGAQDRGSRVVFMGTFSTTLVPSLRLGYLVVPQDLIPAFTNARSISQGHASLLEQMVLAEMMNRGTHAAHVRRMRKLYRERQEVLVSTIKEHLGYFVPEFERTSGMHVVLPLVREANDVRLAQRLAETGILTRPLSPFFSGGEAQQGLLLGFAAFRPEELTRAGEKLSALSDYVARSEPGCS
ncbi:MAG: PLP-dependent aminotransferase family protein [Pseudomonadota bacterium]